MNKTIKLFLLIVAIITVMAGCGGDDSASSSKSNSESGVKELNLMSGMSIEGEKQAFKEIIADFEKENPGIKINANFLGSDYEQLIRVKMGANDMPDLFDTHGWSTTRYSEYVEDLQDMAWVENLDPELKPIITDEDGKVYTYPLNQAKDGIQFNATLLEEYGIELPTTYDEFIDALHIVKEKSNGEVTPLWIPGVEAGNLAQLFDVLATPLLVTSDSNNHGEALLDGSFDWSNYTFLPEMLKEMNDEGLLNKDVLTADRSQVVQLMAQGKIAFTAITGSLGPDVQKVNSKVKVGTIPVPAIHEDDDPSWIGGERYTVSVWKDSKYKEEAKLFIDYISQPEVAKKLSEATSYPAALTNVDAENYYAEYYDMFSDVRVEPYFDRVYFPSGIWDTMGRTAQELLSGTLTPEQVSEEMGAEYNRLRTE